MDLSTLSLIVAALAVVAAPLVSWITTKLQINTSLVLAHDQTRTSLETANKQIIAPMRQAWINKLRDLVAELISLSQRYYAVDDSFTNEGYQRLVLLEAKIKLMLNPQEPPHQKLEKAIREIVGIKYKKKWTSSYLRCFVIRWRMPRERF